MTSHKERAYCHWYARDLYSGLGDVVELGCWLGSLTVPLAMGLAENRRDAVRGRRVQAFDRFVWESWMDGHASLMATELEGRYAAGESFREAFDSQLGPWKRLVDVHERDLLEPAWDGGDIEFLLVDAMKSWELARSTLRDFFPHLIPGVSLVMHQDFSHYETYWIHLLMHRLRDHFEVSFDVPESGSTVFVLRSEIPAALLSEDYAIESFSTEEIEAAFRHSLALVGSAKAPDVVAAKLLALIEKGELDRAERERERWRQLIGSPEGELARVASLLSERLESAADGRDRGVA
jgi:hypothetical protein